MKDKEKQIESKALTLGNELYCKQDKFDMSNPYEVAEAVIELGYRKIPEDSVVLSRELYNEMVDDVKISKDKLVRIIDSSKEKASKETAEKIWLQAKTIVDKTKHLVQGREYLHIDALKEIVKSVGVEIKE